MLRNFTLLIILAASISAFAQNGSISGQITDGRDSVNKPIFGAQVFIEGTQYGAFTDMDGKYQMPNVVPGKYDITVSYVLIGNTKIEGVKVGPGEKVIANTKMGQSVNEEVGIRIVLTKNKESENAAVNEMKESAEVVEIVSNKEMSAKGDNRASDAAKRVSGVTIVEGKYAYIRGLSDRYSKTLLNGAEIPGLDPDRVAVQLDLFPSLFIQSMNVVKTFSPDLPGDFTGGLIDIKTRESFDSLTVKASIGIGFNPQVNMNKDFLLYKGGNTDWLGYDDGTRDFSPEVNASLEQGGQFKSVTSLNNEADIKEYEKFNKSLNNQLEPEKQTVPFDHNLNLTMGNSFKIARTKDSLKPARKLGYFVGLNYRRSYDYYNNGKAGRYELDNTTNISDEFFTRRNISNEQGQDDVLLGTIANVFMRFNPKHKISLNYVHNHTGTSQAQYGEGFDDQTDGTFRIRRLEYLQRSMNTAQVTGEHIYDTLFFGTPTTIDWFGSYTISKQAQPDLRFLLDEYNTENDVTTYKIKSNVTVPTRFNRDMTQQSVDAKVNLTKKIALDSAEIVLKTGASFVSRQRDFSEIRLLYKNTNPAFEYNGNGNDYISDQNLSVSVDTGDFDRTTGQYLVNYSVPTELQNQFSLENQYTARQNIYAGYLMGNFPITKKLELLTGARLEVTDMYVNSASDKPNTDGALNNADILPAVNFTYNFFKKKLVPYKSDSTKFKKQDLKLQTIYSRTLARPTFREIAPFQSFNFLNGSSEIGNPNLERVLIDNLDLRLEFYPNSGELISFSVFYKKLTNPIERTTTSLDGEFTWVNAKTGNIMGVEAEFRKDLEAISPALKNFKLGVNGSLITSKVLINESELSEITQGDPNFKGNHRPLLGQSPYVANTFLQYSQDSIGLSINLTYNVFGDRMVAVQQNGLPNLYEKGRQELNFNIAKEIGKRGQLTLRFQNLLNPEYTVFHKFQGSSDRYDVINGNGDYIFTQYKKGRSYSLNYAYTF